MEEIHTAAHGDVKASNVIATSDTYFTGCKTKIADCKSLALLDGMFLPMCQYKDNTVDRIESLLAPPAPPKPPVNTGAGDKPVPKKVIKAYKGFLYAGIPGKAVSSIPMLQLVALSANGKETLPGVKDQRILSAVYDYWRMQRFRASDRKSICRRKTQEAATDEFTSKNGHGSSGLVRLCLRDYQME